MTFRECLRQELQTWPAFAGHARDLTLAWADARLDCKLTALDSLGCEFLELSVQDDRLAQATLPDLQRISERLAQRLTYLLEPIRPIEADLEQCVVQMRSVPPERDDGITRYYELLVRRGTGLKLVRFGAAPSAARRVIPAQVTREVFLRLADDLANASRAR